MESTPKKAPRSKFPALLVVALALVALVFVIWRVDSAPSTNDAYASADTIDVVPEVSGRIVELAVTDNQAVKQGDLLFRIDPRPYEANLAKAEASSRRWISKLCSPSVALTHNSLVPTRLMPR